MRIGIGSDHAGFELKELLRDELASHEVTDFGAASLDSCDYPDIAWRVATAVQRGEVDTGILICGTGVGMAIAANKLPGIRAAACSEPYTARLTRDHNNANILCIGARVVGPGVASDIVATWLATGYSAGERHQRRLDKIAALERGDSGDQ